jgi:hypothetical protein
MSRHQNAGQNHDIKIANRSYENVAKLQHLGKQKSAFDSIRVILATIQFII